MDKRFIRQMLINEEGMILTPYRCTADKLTIGVGRNLDDRGISEDTAYQMLNEDIDLTINELKDNIDNFDSYPVDVQYTLVDLCFNMGIRRLMSFKKMLSYLAEGLETRNFTKAAVELMDSKYAKQLPLRAKRNHDRLFNA